MTDRELLELAAKAAGYNMAKVLDGYPMYMEGYGIWNPLADDGDAMRLMVRLRLEPRFIDNSHRNGAEPSRVTLHNYGDPLAATRRAIVRAAAEIGRGIAQHAARTDLPEDNYYKSMAEVEEIGRAAAEIGKADEITRKIIRQGLLTGFSERAGLVIIALVALGATAVGLLVARCIGAFL